MKNSNKPQKGCSACTLLLLLCIFLLAACAEGYESPKGFDMGVSGTQMVTPIGDSISFKVNTEGTVATVSWPLVPGAGGHEVTFENVDDPQNPFIVDGYDKKIVDGSKFTVSVTEDSRYRMTMRTLGNHDLGNIDVAEPSVFEFSTLVEKVATIPSGSDITTWWKDFKSVTAPFDHEVAIELEPSGDYIISDTLDFGGYNLTFRGDKIHRPTVKIQGTANIQSYSGLKVKFINFDCSESSANGVFGMSVSNLPDSIKSQNLGYLRDGSPINNIYIVRDPLYISHCWFKDVPRGFLNDNGVECAWWYVTIDDCIIQLNNASSNQGFLCLQNKGRVIKNVKLTNNTIFNIQENKSAYFVRYSHPSNANPQKVFGTTPGMDTQTFTISNCTLSKVYTGQKFANNMSATGQALTIDHTIFYDINSVRQLPRYGGFKTFKFNFWWGITLIDEQDKTQTDTGGSPFVSIYDPLFRGDVLQSLDLSKPNGGVDFTPGEYQIVVNRGGDPRWLPAVETESAQ